MHVSDDTGRIAMLETRTFGDAIDDHGTAEELVRYIYSNHLQSASLELDEAGAIISYEEYHPYGTTSYQAMNTAINAVAKRYRYTGKERDEESGLYYHGARYYIPWLCRWTAVDPLENKFAGLSPYNYCFNNPVMYNDPSGMEGRTVTVQAGQGAWDIAKQQLGENATNAQINELKDNILKWNKHQLGKDQKFEKGQQAYVTNPSITHSEMVVLTEKMVRKHFDSNNRLKDIQKAVLSDLIAYTESHPEQFYAYNGDKELMEYAFSSYLENVWLGHIKMAAIHPKNYSNYNQKVDNAQGVGAKSDLILSRGAEADKIREFVMFTLGELTEYFTGAGGFSVKFPTRVPSRSFSIGAGYNDNAAKEVVPNSGPIVKSLGAASRAEMIAKKFNLQLTSPYSRQVLNSLDETVENFISKYRKSSIYGELPGGQGGNFSKMTIEQALNTKNTTVRKLLIDKRFLKK